MPKLSKAARRFYNENFKEPPQRLSKVLAAAGGNNNQTKPSLSPIFGIWEVFSNAIDFAVVASRRTSEELIFDGKVTVNGSICNTPQVKKFSLLESN